MLQNKNAIHALCFKEIMNICSTKKEIKITSLIHAFIQLSDIYQVTATHAKHWKCNRGQDYCPGVSGK